MARADTSSVHCHFGPASCITLSPDGDRSVVSCRILPPVDVVSTMGDRRLQGAQGSPTDAILCTRLLTAFLHLASRIPDDPLTLGWAVVLFVEATLTYLAVPRLSRWFNGARG